MADHLFPIAFVPRHLSDCTERLYRWDHSESALSRSIDLDDSARGQKLRVVFTCALKNDTHAPSQVAHHCSSLLTVLVKPDTSPVKGHSHMHGLVRTFDDPVNGAEATYGS